MFDMDMQFVHTDLWRIFIMLGQIDMDDIVVREPVNREELVALVLQEADRLREHATKEEIGRLDFNKMDPELIDSCIYGQMTGDCHSLRALKLLNLAAKPYSQHLTRYEPDGDVFKRRKRDRVNKLRAARYTRTMWSPIEFYISREDANSEGLIAYIQGEIDTVTL